MQTVHTTKPNATGLSPHDELRLPLHRRVVTQYAPAEAGGTELRLYCGAQEISFDEPAFFAFGEVLFSRVA